MEGHSQELHFPFEHVAITSRADLNGYLDELARSAKERGIKPFIHFDTHGNKDEGLRIAAEDVFVSWEELAEKLTTINVHTQNNLAVVGATCFGLYAIKPLSINTPTPFYLLLAPKEEVGVGYLETNVPNFYRCLFELGDVDEAHTRHLSGKFSYFHCEKMLFVVIARYIAQQCKGKGGAARRERLLTEILSLDTENRIDDLSTTRKQLKAQMRPDQRLVDRYAEKFLIGRPCSFDIEDLLNYVEQSTSH